MRRGELLPIGCTVRQYQILRRLGRGGMAEVYLAVNRLGGFHVAIKVPYPELAQDPGIRQRFIIEAQVQDSMRHANIVRLRDIFEERGLLLLVMDYIDGQSLEQVLDERPLDVDEAIGVSLAVLSALGYAHRREPPVVHRDIKPANILLTSAGEPMVADFGIARVVGLERLTKAGGVVGTFEYMSPEQVVGEDPGPSSDVYSFGITLFRMLTGVAPFPQTSSSGLEVMNAHVEEEPPEIEEFRMGVPRWLKGFMGLCLRKSPDHRFPDARMAFDFLHRKTRSKLF